MMAGGHHFRVQQDVVLFAEGEKRGSGNMAPFALRTQGLKNTQVHKE